MIKLTRLTQVYENDNFSKMSKMKLRQEDFFNKNTKIERETKMRIALLLIKLG